MSKPRIFSGVQPSGNLHIGNYLGAISQWVSLQDKYECIFSVVDYNAITVPQKPDELRSKIIEIAKLYIASGIDVEKSVIFQQSDIKEHTELAWVLNTITRMSDLNKMTQFKDKGGENENVGVGLYDYPVLMAADILLYDTEVVPVGDDQVQHVELARDLAKRFNHQFTDTLRVPKAEIRKEGARIMGLDNPEKKMSKSAASVNNYIALTDEPAVAKKKIMKAVADSGTEVKFDFKNKPGISNLLIINSLLSGESVEDLVKSYEGAMYGDFKKSVAGVVEEFLTQFQEKLSSIKDSDVRDILDAGAKKIQPIATETMGRVKERIGVK